MSDDTYYTYLIVDPSIPFEDLPGKPFYVGKGHGNRAHEHLKPTHNRNKLKVAKIKSLRGSGIEPFVHFYKTNLTELEAFSLEVDLIAKWGRKIDSSGNVLSGGAGVPFDWTGKRHSKETIEKMKVRIVSDYTRRLISDQRKGKPKSESHKAALSLARTGFKDTPETCAKKRATHTGMKYSEAHCKAIGEGQKHRKPTEEQKEHLSKLNSHHFIITSPDGETFEVDHLLTWAPEHNLSYQCLLKVANGLKQDWKGWRCQQSIQ